MSDKHTDCQQYREWMISILYPRDMEKLPAEVDEHIRSCPDCRKELESLKATLEMLRSIDLNIAPPKGLENRIMQAIEEEAADEEAVRKGAAAAQEAGLMDIIVEKVVDFFRRTKPLVTHPAFATAMVVLIIGGFLLLIKDVVRKGQEGIFEQDREQVLPAQPAPPLTQTAMDKEIAGEPRAETWKKTESEGKDETVEKWRVEVEADKAGAEAAANELEADRAMAREATGETVGWDEDEGEGKIKLGAVDKIEKETKEAAKHADMPAILDGETTLKGKGGGFYLNGYQDDLADSMGSEGLAAGESSIELITKGDGKKSSAGPSRHETTKTVDKKVATGGIVASVPKKPAQVTADTSVPATTTGAGTAPDSIMQPGGAAKSEWSSPFVAAPSPTPAYSSAPPPVSKKKASKETGLDYAMPMEAAELEEEASADEAPAPAPAPASASAISAAKAAKKTKTTSKSKKSKKKGKSAPKTYYKFADSAEEVDAAASLAPAPTPTAKQEAKPKTKPKPKAKDTQAKKPAKVMEPAKEEEKAVSGKKQDKDTKKDPYSEARDRFSSGDYDGALSYLQSIVKKTTPSSASMASVYHMLAKTWKKKGNSGKALIYYENLFARYPSYSQISQARWEAALLYIAAGDTKQAKKLLEKLVKNPSYKDKAKKKLDSLK